MPSMLDVRFPRRRSAARTRLEASIVILFAIVAPPRTGRAQSAAAPRAQSRQPDSEQPPLTAGWQDGFLIQTPSGDTRLLFGMVAQTDGRFSLDDPTSITNTFTLRMIRPTFTGRISRYFEFKVMPDFGNGTAVMADAYLEVRFSNAVRVRAGKGKTPVGHELLQGDAFLLFPERALATSLVPNRDIGAQVRGELAGGTVTYAGGVFNGIPDGSSLTTELDTNNGKELAGRIEVQPFLDEPASGAPSALSGLGFHLGGSTGREEGRLPSFRTSVGQTYFSYDPDARAGGRRNRVSPAVFYYYGSFGAFAELMRSTQAVAAGGATVDVTNHAWEVSGSYVLTGEAASDRGVRPRESFDPASGRWGALQIVARVTRLSIDPLAFTRGLAAPGASRHATSFTVGANWYPTSYVKYYVTYERTTFRAGEGGGEDARPAESVILFRVQLGF
jgi:phosphate-selective porin OprO/OprP